MISEVRHLCSINYLVLVESKLNLNQALDLTKVNQLLPSHLHHIFKQLDYQPSVDFHTLILDVSELTMLDLIIHYY